MKLRIFSCLILLPLVLGMMAGSGPQGEERSLEISGAAIDVHTHLMSQALTDGLTGGGVPASTADDLIARLDEANVQKAVVLSLGYWGLLDDSNMAPENDFVAAEVAKYLDRLVGFFGINPLCKSAINEIDRGLDLLGMVGIKLQLPSSVWIGKTRSTSLLYHGSSIKPENVMSQC